MPETATSLQFTLADLGAISGWIIAIISVVIAARVASRNRSKDEIDNNQKLTRIDERTKNIERDILKNTAMVERLDEKVDKNTLDIARVELSAKSAHKRLDQAGIGKVEQ